MTTDDRTALRAQHHRIMQQPGGPGTPLVARCWHCREDWPCAVTTLLDALDAAETQAAWLREYIIADSQRASGMDAARAAHWLDEWLQGRAIAAMLDAPGADDDAGGR